MEGRGGPVKCSITSQLDFLTGVCGVFGVLGVWGVCGWDEGVEGFDPGGSRSNSTRGLPPSFTVCCRRLAHLLVLFKDPVVDLPTTSLWNQNKTKFFQV